MPAGFFLAFGVWQRIDAMLDLLGSGYPEALGGPVRPRTLPPVLQPQGSRAAMRVATAEEASTRWLPAWSSP